MPSIPFSPALADEYRRLFDTCHVRPERAADVDRLVARIAGSRDRYVGVADPLGIPWYVVGVIHCMEASLDFTRHLHNGDPLTGRTVQEPPGRPRSGSPPFTWEQSATDSLQFQRLTGLADWSLPRTLYRLEAYNGFGYRRNHPEVLTPYLWSFSSHYTSGKYVRDGIFSSTAPSRQCGAAVLLRRMSENGSIQFLPDGTPITRVGPSGGRVPRTFDDLAPLVRYSTTRSSPAVEDLQRLLNTFPGIFVKVDGVPGKRTSEAFRKVTGHYLVGDPRANA
jgi:lysozyme family protein